MVGSDMYWTGARHGIFWFLLLTGFTTLSLAQDGRGVTTVVPDAQRARFGFDAKDSTALFVGVRDFEGEGIDPVPYAVDDAVDLAHLFALELQLVAPKKVVLALSGDPHKGESQARLKALKEAGARVEQANQSKILRYLHEQSKAAGPDGLFLVGLATHGFTHEGRIICSPMTPSWPSQN